MICFAECVVPGAGAFEIAVCDALDSFKNTVASRARLGVKVLFVMNLFLSLLINMRILLIVNNI